MGWGAHCREDSGPGPSRGAGGGTYHSCCEGARMRSLGKQDKNNHCNAQHHPLRAASSSAGALLSATWKPLTLTTSFLPSPSSHRTTSWGEWALPAVSSPPQPITIRSPPPRPDRQTWHLPLCVSWLPTSTVPSPSPLSRITVIQPDTQK